MTIPELHEAAIRAGFRFATCDGNVTIASPPIGSKSPETRLVCAVHAEMRRQWSEFIGYVRERCQ